jgi:hypothetical protein
VKLALVLLALEVVAIYAYLAGFDAGSQRTPREEPFRGD